MHAVQSSHFLCCFPPNLLQERVEGLECSPLILRFVGAVQVKDKWSFQMTARYGIYGTLLQRYNKPDYVPQVVIDTGVQGGP